MIELKVKNRSGSDVGDLQIDEAKLGGKVKKRLMHNAVLMYHAKSRQGSACTKTRAEIAGSRKKMYRQKGTGRARAGHRMSGVRVGGGRIFGPKPRDFGFDIPKKMRRAALKSALLAKLKDGEVLVVDSLGLDTISTRRASILLKTLGLDGKKVMVSPSSYDKSVYLSVRNIKFANVKPATDLNALDLLTNKILLIERAGLEALIDAPLAGSPKAEKAAEEAPEKAAEPEAKADDSSDTNEDKSDS